MSSNLTVGFAPKRGIIHLLRAPTKSVTSLRVRKAVIPAAGHGTRLLPLTLSQPKELVACGSAPVIAYVLDELRTAGITQVLLISRKGKAPLEDFVFDSWPGACVVRQAEQRGLGHAVSLAEDWVGDEPFVVSLGDTIIQSSRDPAPMQRLVEQAGRDRSIVLVREVLREQVHRYGVVKPAEHPHLGQSFSLSGIVEKPTAEEAPSNLAIAGRYLFSPAIFAALAKTEPSRDGEIQLTDAMSWLCSEPGRMMAAPLLTGERRFDIGDLQSYFEAFAALSSPSAGS